MFEVTEGNTQGQKEKLKIYIKVTIFKEHAN